MNELTEKQILTWTKKLVKVVKKSSKIYLNKNFEELVEKHKFENDDVTNLDVKTQDFLEKKCLRIFKICNFIGEEKQTPSESLISVIIDPIDGTYNFKHNIKNFGTQVCVLFNKLPIISVLYLPNENKVYCANKFGAFENGKKITVSNCDNFKDAVVELGDFSTKLNFREQQQYVKILSETFKRVRINGSSCMDACLLARGSVDLYILYTINPWDKVPGQYLIKQAGGTIVANKENNTFIAGNENLVNKAIKLLNFKWFFKKIVKFIKNGKTRLFRHFLVFVPILV